MIFSFRPEKISHIIGTNDGVLNTGTSRDFVNFDLVVKDSKSVFELGDSYVISSPFIHQTHHKNKLLADVSCSFKPISSVSDDEKSGLNLSSSVIGYGNFFEESSSDDDYQSPALLLALYIPDEDYKTIIHKLDMGVKCESLTVSFEDKSGKNSEKLKYGWEPDGSRIIWDYSGQERKSQLYLTSYELTFNEPLEASNETEVADNEAVLKSKFAKDLKEIKYALYVVAFASFLSILARFGS